MALWKSPQDPKSTFEPQVVKKRQKDISDIDQKIISVCQRNDTPSANEPK